MFWYESEHSTGIFIILQYPHMLYNAFNFLSIQISFKLVALFSRKISFSATDRHISRNFKL